MHGRPPCGWHCFWRARGRCLFCAIPSAPQPVECLPFFSTTCHPHRFPQYCCSKLANVVATAEQQRRWGGRSGGGAPKSAVRREGCSALEGLCKPPCEACAGHFGQALSVRPAQALLVKQVGSLACSPATTSPAPLRWASKGILSTSGACRLPGLPGRWFLKTFQRGASRLMPATVCGVLTLGTGGVVTLARGEEEKKERGGGPGAVVEEPPPSHPTPQLPPPPLLLQSPLAWCPLASLRQSRTLDG